MTTERDTLVPPGKTEDLCLSSKRELYTLNLKFYKEGGQSNQRKNKGSVDLLVVTTLALVCGVRAVYTSILCMHIHSAQLHIKRQEEEEVQSQISGTDMQAGHYSSLLGSYE